MSISPLLTPKQKREEEKRKDHTRAHLIQNVDQLVFADSSAQLTALCHPGEQLLDGASAVRFHERYPRDCSRLGRRSASSVGHERASERASENALVARKPRRERMLSRRVNLEG